MSFSKLGGLGWVYESESDRVNTRFVSDFYLMLFSFVKLKLVRTTRFAVNSRAWYKRHVLKNGRAENIGRGGFSTHRATQAHFRGQAI